MASQKQEAFNYITIKGGLFLFKDKNTLEKNFFLRIYNSKNYSLRINLEINQNPSKNKIKVKPNIYCFIFGCLGFLFGSIEEDEQFKTILDIREPGQETQDNTEKYNLFQIKDTDDLFLDLIDNLFDELLGNMEYDKEDNLFNLFVDKKYPKKSFKKMFYDYDMNKLYPLRPIVLIMLIFIINQIMQIY